MLFFCYKWYWSTWRLKRNGKKDGFSSFFLRFPKLCPSLWNFVQRPLPATNLPSFDEAPTGCAPIVSCANSRCHPSPSTMKSTLWESSLCRFTQLCCHEFLSHPTFSLSRRWSLTCGDFVWVLMRVLKIPIKCWLKF